MLSAFWKKVNNFGIFPATLAVAFPIAFIITLELFSIPVTDLFFSNWSLNLLSVSNFISNILSTTGYFGRVAEILLNLGANTPYGELIGILVGMISGAAIAASFIALSAPIPFLGTLGMWAYPVFINRYISIFAGFGSRLGRTFDTGPQARPLFEKIFVNTAELLGVLLGAGIFYFNFHDAINIQGVLNFFAGPFGSTFSKPLFGISFACCVGSLCGSCADYVARLIIECIHSNRQPVTPQPGRKQIPLDHKLNWYDEINLFHHGYENKRYNEYSYATGGVITGAIIAAINIASGLTRHLDGPAASITNLLVSASSISSWGGNAFRIGRIKDAYDNYKNLNHTRTIETSVNPFPAPEASIKPVAAPSIPPAALTACLQQASSSISTHAYSQQQLNRATNASARTQGKPAVKQQGHTQRAPQATGYANAHKFGAFGQPSRHESKKHKHHHDSAARCRH